MQHPCSKCLTPVGGEAVQLKNGLYMCPSCYHRAYPPVTGKSAAAPRFFVSIEGLLAIALTIGGIVGAYKFYTHVVESARAHELELKRADEAAAQRALADRAIAEAEQQRSRRARQEVAELDRQKLELKRKNDALAEEARQASLAQKRRDAADQAARESAVRDEKLRARQSQDAASMVASVTAEWTDLIARSAELDMTIRKLEGDKAAKEKSAKIHGVIFEARRTALESLWKQYNLSRDAASTGKEIWEVEFHANAFVRARYFGGATLITESQGPKIVDHINQTAADARTNLGYMKTEQLDLDLLNQKLTDSIKTRDAIKSRLTELKATQPSIVNKLPDIDSAKTSLKRIRRIDGRIILAQSIMKLDKIVRYKDEKGDWQTIDADQVEKIDINSMP